MFHHHLGKYVWNFFQASNKQIQGKKKWSYNPSHPVIFGHFTGTPFHSISEIGFWGPSCKNPMGGKLVVKLRTVYYDSTLSNMPHESVKFLYNTSGHVNGTVPTLLVCTHRNTQLPFGICAMYFDYKVHLRLSPRPVTVANEGFGLDPLLKL